MLRRHAVTARVLALFCAACSSSSLTPGSLLDDPSSTSPSDAGALDAGSFSSACALELGLDEAHCASVSALALPAALPRAVGNRYADDLDAARLGFLVFYDPRFSGVPDMRCATCHLPEQAFGDGRAVPASASALPLVRNSPSILNAAWAGPYYFWDGRADSLWSQPLFALESEHEMASSRLEIAHALFNQALYREKYELVFGALPDMTRFPPRGKPGDADFDALSPEDRAQIDRVFGNFGKALEAYMRKVATGPSALDRYLAGDRMALEPTAKAGLRALATRGCLACHGGPALTDGAFHPTEGPISDLGRAAAVEILRANPFNGAGPHADPETAAAPALPTAARPEDHGAFRTPTLRNVARTAPYGHDGRYPTLEALLVSSHGGVVLEPEERTSLLALLLSLNGSYPARPWSDWPAR